MRITLSKVRSFVDHHEVELRPLTLLVGENSAGKSTFLAMTEAVLNDRYLLRRPTFNVPPYDLGSFDDIASFLGGRGGRAPTFSIGLKRATDDARVISTFVGEQGQPTLSKVDCAYLDSQFVVSFTSNTIRLQGQLGPETQRKANSDEAKSSDFETIEFNTESELPEDPPGRETAFDWRFFASQPLLMVKDSQEKAARNVRTFMGLQRLLPIFSLGPTQATARSIAPVRTRPRRVYDRAQDQPDPEGDYIPFVLARTLSKAGAESEALRKTLTKFGVESGLFLGISARRLSRKTLWPFQIEVENTGPSKNLIDVGYGVSQALPVLVESILPGPKTLLVQQPEVHLHPRAQAALGTLFAELVAQKRRSFVVETHSDYLIDRVRLAVAQNVLSPDDVSIVFLHRPKAKTKTHELRIDKTGNVQGAPSVYRDFFLREQMRLLSDS
jgi:energy-coupling factor transporter ATP-binding protein EcfA2